MIIATDARTNKFFIVTLARTTIMETLGDQHPNSSGIGPETQRTINATGVVATAAALATGGDSAGLDVSKRIARARASGDEPRVVADLARELAEGLEGFPRSQASEILARNTPAQSTGAPEPTSHNRSALPHPGSQGRREPPNSSGTGPSTSGGRSPFR